MRQPEARALELEAVTRAEGALTRCFDLLKVDNDLISKSRETLNRGERSGG
jgi:hypothetical protein